MQKNLRPGQTNLFFFPYAYDQVPGGVPREGVPSKQLGSKARCDALIELVLKVEKLFKKLAYSTEKIRFITAGGYTKKSPLEPTEEVKSPLSVDLGMYIMSKTKGKFNVFMPVLGWGTYAETKGVIDYVNHPESGLRNEAVKFIVSTNWCHMHRVKLCWRFLKPKEWQVAFVEADQSFTFKEHCQETVKFFVYFYRFLFKKW